MSIGALSPEAHSRRWRKR
ncbi:hypothetical protein ACLB1R_22955 [Escherichia coli]